MQMLGRAGRPQFDRNAVAVIMTRQEKVRRYELMVSGQEILESCLHRNLIDHLNAEIGLGTIKDLSTARKWLSGTFLCVRMKHNPEYYLLEGDSDSRDVSERLERICSRDISLLREHNLIEGDSFLKSTEFGDAMARYCVQFETAKNFLILPPKARLSEILSTIAQAAEFKEIRFRSGEKQLYKDLNKSPMIKFPIHVNLDLPAHKVSLIIQSQLGAVELPVNEKNNNNGMQYQTDVNIIFQHVHRLIRCIIDFHLCTEDSVALRNALMLCRSLGAKCWDDSPLTLRQIDGIGPIAVRKLVNANIKSVEELANAEAQKIEMLLGRRPPFGMELLRKLKDFPTLRVDVSILGRPTTRTGQGATICVKANIGFMNEKPPEVYRGKPIYLVFLAETSDGRKVHFARINSRKVGSGQDIQFSVLLTDPAQLIVCHVMCDEFAGTLRSASIKPSNIPSVAWQSIDKDPTFPAGNKQTGQTNCLRRKNGVQANRSVRREASEDFGADELGDEDFWQAVAGDGDTELQRRVNFHNENNPSSRKGFAANSGGNCKQDAEPEERTEEEEEWQPTRLNNGKWACNHACKDKTKCKHLCCREGQEKPPKPPKKAMKRPNTINGTLPMQKQSKSKVKHPHKGQTQLVMPKIKGTTSSSPSSDSVSEVDLTQEPTRRVKPSNTYRSRELESLQRLHSTVQREHTSPNLRNDVTSQKNTRQNPEQKELSTDCGDDWSKLSATIIRQEAARRDVLVEFEELKNDANGKFGSSDSLLDAAIVGSADSRDLQPSRTEADREIGATNELSEVDANMIIAENLCSPNTKPGHPSSVRQTKLLTKRLEQLPTLSEPTNNENTLTESSSPLFVTDNAKPKRKADGVELPESPMKKPKRVKVLEPPANEHTKPTNVSKENLNVAENSTKKNKDLGIGEVKASSIDGIDPWILREFGKYVNFV
jgi:ATP-dependent DNA helicase HFM1/MER3